MKTDIYDDRIKRVATPFSHEYSDYNLQILFASVHYNFSSNLNFFLMQKIIPKVHYPDLTAIKHITQHMTSNYPDLKNQCLSQQMTIRHCEKF
jgi:hypothetical protein